MNEAREVPAGAACKICGSTDLVFLAHTARCRTCGVLLLWPYPPPDAEVAHGVGKPFAAHLRQWYLTASFRNHANFTNMLRFTLDESWRGRALDILDYGGGAGQFALVCKSHFPDATVYVTDIDDAALFDEWRPLNVQIPFRTFAADPTRFDVIFLNDVFEHDTHPHEVLQTLASKLKPSGRIFIDTPRQFWLYPFSRLCMPPLYGRLLRGTISIAHLQIWSHAAFHRVVAQAGLKVLKYEEANEFTMPMAHYLMLMGIRQRWLVAIASVFYRWLRALTPNKIVCVLERDAS
jgi:SAM-dependent methyltransferase